MSNSKGIEEGAQFLQIQKHHSVKNWFCNFECRKTTHGLHRTRGAVSFQPMYAVYNKIQVTPASFLTFSFELPDTQN